MQNNYCIINAIYNALQNKIHLTYWISRRQKAIFGLWEYHDTWWNETGPMNCSKLRLALRNWAISALTMELAGVFVKKN